MNGEWSDYITGNSTNYGSSEFYDYESKFNQDFDGDGAIGRNLSSFTAIETYGDVSLYMDPSGMGYVQDSTSGEQAGIYAWGMHLGNSLWHAQEIIAAETIDGSNYIVWEDSYDPYNLSLIHI